MVPIDIDRWLQKFTLLVVPIVVPKVKNITKAIFILLSTESWCIITDEILTQYFSMNRSGSYMDIIKIEY